MDLEDCYNNGSIKITRVNPELIASLIEMSQIKEDTVNSATLNQRNISPYISMAYDSLRELLEALCISKGYKVTSHLCLGELLASQIPDFDLNSFDRFRYVRNGINYYGTKVDFGQGKELIRKMFLMKNSLAKKHLSGFTKN
jgi:hypothetical protein